jgi:hypothetical protein
MTNTPTAHSRLPLPFEDDTLFAWFDTAQAFVNFNGSSLVNGMINRLNGHAALQTDATMQPTWNATAMNKYPGLVFNGNQRFTMPLSSLSGINIPITFVIALMGGSLNDLGFGVPIALGSSTLANVYFTILPVSTEVDLDRAHDTSASDIDGAIYTFANTAPHVFTGIYDGTSVILRVDGVQKAIVPATTSTGKQVSIDQLAIGDYTDGAVGGFGHGYFTGTIGPILIYKGGFAPIEAEKWMMQTVGIST